MQFQKDDGGRAAAGCKGSAGDCVARSIAIASQRPYEEIYDRLAEGNASQRRGKHQKTGHGKRSARDGIFTGRKWFKDYMRELGFEWVSCMGVGEGCHTHLKNDELPVGRLVLSLRRHYAAVIEGVLHDTFDSSPARTYEIIENGVVVGSKECYRCVYGYWQLNTP
jgi:hypothetical protein